MRQPAGGDDSADLPDDSGSDDDPNDDPDDDPDNDSNGQPIDGFDFSPDDVHFDEHGVLHTSDEILIKLREYLGLDTASSSGEGVIRTICNECIPHAPERAPNRVGCVCFPCGTCHPDNCGTCEVGEEAEESCPFLDFCHDRVCCLSLPVCLIDDCLAANELTACAQIPVMCGINHPTSCDIVDCDPDNGCYSYPKCDDNDPCTADACYLGVCSYTASPCDPECDDVAAKCAAGCGPSPQCCADPDCCDNPDPCCGSTDPCCGVECAACEACEDGVCVSTCPSGEFCCAEGNCCPIGDTCCEGTCCAGEAPCCDGVCCGLTRGGEAQVCCNDGSCCDDDCCGNTCCGECEVCVLDTNGLPGCEPCNECQKCEGGECVPDPTTECNVCDGGRCNNSGECLPVSCTFQVVSQPPDSVCASASEQATAIVEYSCTPFCPGMSLTLEPEFHFPDSEGWSVSPGQVACAPPESPATSALIIVPGYEATLDGNPYLIEIHALLDDEECASADVLVEVRDPDLDVAGVSEEEEWEPGAFICLNTDDDNGNGIPDMDDLAALSAGGQPFFPPPQEDDLVEVTLKTADYANEAEIRLRYQLGNQRIRVYREQPDGKLVRLGQTGHTWPAGGDFVNPTTVWIEGILPSEAIGDGRIRLLHLPQTWGPMCADEINWTVRAREFTGTDWLVVHDPAFERDHCQPTSTPRCQQAELMGNIATLEACCFGPDASAVEVRLVQENPGGNEVLVIVPGSEENMCWTFEFDTKVGSMTNGAKTDTNGGIYVEGALLPDGPTDLILGQTTYAFELWVDNELRDTKPVTIAPLLTDLSYAPDILADPPDTLDPYSDFFYDPYLASDTCFVWFPPPGYGCGEGFGLRAEYDLDDDVSEFRISVSNDPSSGRPGDAIGTYDLLIDDPELRTSGIVNKTVKWEGFIDNGFVTDSYGAPERANEVFMDGVEAERGTLWPLGDGINQTFRGMAPRSVAREGDYFYQFRLGRSEDGSQIQELKIPFTVKYEFE